jgi:hypothetical protein
MKIAISCDPNAQIAKEEIIKFIEKNVLENLKTLEVPIQYMLTLP